MAKVSSNHSKAHMDDMREKAARTNREKVLKNVREFRKLSAAYFEQQDANDELYSEPGLANYLGWMLTKLQRNWDYNDGKDDEEIDRQVEAFENGSEVTDPRAVMSYYVRMAYQRIQEQVDSNPIYREKGMVPRSIFLNKQKRLGGRNDQPEMNTKLQVELITGNGADADCWK